MKTEQAAKSAISDICSCNDLLCVMNSEGQLFFCNARMKKTYQLADPQTTTVNFFTALPPAEVAKFRSAFKASQASRLAYSFVQKGRKNGNPVTWIVSRVFKNADTELFLCGAVYSSSTPDPLIDIQSAQFQETERSEQQISNDRLQYVSKLTSDAVWEWDVVSGRIIRNKKLMDLIGEASAEEQTLNWWIDRVHPEDQAALTVLLNEVTEKQDLAWQCEYRFLCADGEYKNMLDRGFVIYENGRPQKMIGSLHDVTEEKLMQHILTEESLRQYRTLSENSLRVQEQERSRFGRELHDNVNQILSAAGLYIGMLTLSTEDQIMIKEKAYAYTQQAIEEIRRLSREMITPQVEGNLLVENIERMVHDIEETTPVHFTFNYTDRLLNLSPGKKVALYRIVQEQTKNVIKYSKATQVWINIEYREPNILLQVRDNGIGFDAATTKPGIGLNSIRERTRFYNGKTQIISAPGKGTSVEVEIPFV